MGNTKHFMSNVNYKEFRINFQFNFNSSNVVYLLECGVCGLQCVGSTSTLSRLRFNTKNYTYAEI